MQGLLEALDGVGLKLRPEVPFDAQLLIKYFFRDAKPQAEAKAVTCRTVFVLTCP
jgi:hypothetical protein